MRAGRARLWFCQLLAALPWRADGKVQLGQVRIGGPRANNQWKFVSKFGYSIGVGSFAMRVRLEQPRTLAQNTSVELNLFLDEDWPEVEALDQCARTDKARGTHSLNVLAQGGWGDWVNGTLHQAVRPHIWYFAMQDCTHNLQNFTHRFRFEFRALQPDGTHNSVELQWMFVINLAAFLVFNGFFYRFRVQCKAFARSADSLHPVIWCLLVSMIFQYAAQGFMTLDLYFYFGNGMGSKPLNVIGEIFFMLAQVIQSTLLIVIAMGYTLLQSEIGDLDLMIPVAFMMAILHIMVVGFGKIQDEASYKYHEFEGIVGIVICVFRLLLYLWFMWACHSTADEGGMRLKGFLRQFKLVGTVYFTAFPLMFFFVRFLAPYLQHKAMTVGLLAMQMCANYWMTQLFLTRGDYFKVSTLSSTFLPGNRRFAE